MKITEIVPVTPFVRALTSAEPATAEYKRAFASPEASVETVIVVDVGPFAKCARPAGVVVNTTGIPGFLICAPYWSYSVAVIL